MRILTEQEKLKIKDIQKSFITPENFVPVHIAMNWKNGTKLWASAPQTYIEMAEQIEKIIPSVIVKYNVNGKHSFVTASSTTVNLKEFELEYPKFLTYKNGRLIIKKNELLTESPKDFANRLKEFCESKNLNIIYFRSFGLFDYHLDVL